MLFHFWASGEEEPCALRDFAFLRGRLGNRIRVDQKHFGCDDARRNRHSKIPNEYKSGTPQASCAPPQRGEFPQLLSRATTGSQEVPQRPASRRKAASWRAA